MAIMICPVALQLASIMLKHNLLSKQIPVWLLRGLHLLIVERQTSLATL